ncbi:hypothetical protein ACIPY0_00090 [Paenarthrobacter nicotinovorans]|jgi:hypothetical protein|uniref:hypothetical protein n=1 Tax=Paenarthrobacter nicotinovorans TaxID=29320 RepID=UPI0037FB65AB
MRELKLLTGKTVLVSTPEATIRGVVESATRAFITLAAAESLDGPNPVAIQGFVLVPVPKVSYVQVTS